MEYRKKIEAIRGQYLRGEINYTEAKDEVEKLLVVMNEKGAKIAREHGRKFNKLTFGYIFR